MAVEFAFLPCTKSFNALTITVAELIVSAIDNLKTIAAWRTRCTRVASYVIDHGSHFPYSLYGEQEGADPKRGAWQNHVIL